jgi:hypothetical protein
MLNWRLILQETQQHLMETHGYDSEDFGVPMQFLTWLAQHPEASNVLSERVIAEVGGCAEPMAEDVVRVELFGVWRLCKPVGMQGPHLIVQNTDSEEHSVNLVARSNVHPEDRDRALKLAEKAPGIGWAHCHGQPAGASADEDEI